jgi:NADPH2:quinone reductase
VTAGSTAPHGTHAPGGLPRFAMVGHHRRRAIPRAIRKDTTLALPRTMRALICRTYGSIDDLAVGDAPVPVPGAGEVLIKVRATAVNYADAIMVGGTYQTKPDLPFSPGLETAGVVAACGPEVRDFTPGDRVMAILAYGGLAQYAIAPAAECYAIPDGMGFAEAGAFPIAYISSDVALRWQGRLEAGETLLVLGAAGGVGLTAVEIGKAMGARVIAAASTPQKLAVAAAHGADAVINYATEKLTDRVMALTDGKGADVCFDPVGGKLFDAALSSLGWGGRIVVVGFVGGVPQIPANRLLVKHRAALGSSLRYFRWHAPDKLARSVAALMDWYRAGKLKPLVTHRLPLARAVEGIRLLTERQAHGKIVVELEAG